MFGLKPKEGKFFELFQQGTDLLCKSSKCLREIMDDFRTIEEKIHEINELEHHADEVTTAIIDRLNQTLITPLDREDIYTLAKVLDDVIDFIQGVAERMILYKTGQPSRGAQELVKILCDCSEVIDHTFRCLNNIRGNRQSLLENATRINELESEADRLYRSEVAKLFEEESNPVNVIKWKEILEHLEEAVDRCEDIADLTKGVVLKYA